MKLSSVSTFSGKDQWVITAAKERLFINDYVTSLKHLWITHKEKFL